ncbi:MAG: DUF3500 domain-containing protein, partial [Gammaproteobacteria bacterium]
LAMLAACSEWPVRQMPPHPSKNASAVSASVSPLQAQFRNQYYSDVHQAVAEFLATLSEAQKAKIQLPYTADYRQRGYCYVLAQCAEFPGLQLRDMTAIQKIALNQLLMKSLSGAGYSRAIQIMNREYLLEEMESKYFENPAQFPVVGDANKPDWQPPARRGGDAYYLAIFGDYESNEPWGIRFEGHHLSLNINVQKGHGQRGARVQVSPFFYGASPVIVPQAPAGTSRWQQEEGQQLLLREAWLARRALQAMRADQRQKGEWNQLPGAALDGGTEVPRVDPSAYLNGANPGVSLRELEPMQQALMMRFVDEFLQTQSADAANFDVVRNDIQQGRVWWFGDWRDLHGEFYVRIQSHGYLIELLQANTFGLKSEIEGNHIHASFRNLQSDWNVNPLGRHIKMHHMKKHHMEMHHVESDGE